ncbi:MAG: hypothetical protein MUC43_08245 [Pirellula sp.]|nr:hypothetical protein [Pirellula sp.]
MKTRVQKLVVAIASIALLVCGMLSERDSPKSDSMGQIQLPTNESTLLASRYPMRNRTPDFFSRSKASKSNRRT